MSEGILLCFCHLLKNTLVFMLELALIIVLGLFLLLSPVLSQDVTKFYP